MVPERVLLVRNSRDSTLAIYPMRKFMGERALGKDGLSQGDRLALGSLGPKVVELDAAEFADWHHSFADFHQHPELAQAVLPYVYFQEDAVSSRAPAIGPPLGASTNSPTAPPASLEPDATAPDAASEKDP